MKKLLRYYAILVLFLPLLSICSISAQSNVELEALRYVKANAENWSLTFDDVSNLRVTDVVRTKHNGVTHVYVTQQINGVDIDGSSISIYVKDDLVGATASRFVADLLSRAPAQTASLSSSAALGSALQDLGFANRRNLKPYEQSEGNVYRFEAEDISSTNIRAQLKYVATESGQYTPAWEYQIASNKDGELWNIFVDANSGEILKKESLTVHCTFEHGYLSHPKGHDASCLETAFKIKQTNKNHDVPEGARYKVVPLPFESPSHGEAEVLFNPAHPIYSPFGWHSDDGDTIADYTHTRGNNVHAFLDRDWNNTSDRDVDGGDSLLFDFPLDFEAEPETYEDAAVTNLFYINNMIHDLAYRYGFDEDGGNFQEFNPVDPLSTGQGGDHVNAKAQRGADDPATCGDETNSGSPCVNNANFGTPSDGTNPSMNMFLWTSTAGNRFLQVDEPVELAGLIETNGAAFGTAITTTPVSGEVVLYNDGTGSPTIACQETSQDLSGKIALIDRATCEFGLKVLNAENAGAIGAIICNFEEALLAGDMGAGDDGGAVTIPSVFITAGDCARIRIAEGNGLIVSLVRQEEMTGPARVDGDFDNGIILHEFTHGISSRLTGGPSNPGGLGATESGGMGEGWSDFFGLISTVRPGDTGDMARGIGTYAQRDVPTGRGIRPFPYSTNMSVNPHTYEDAAFVSVPHGVGAVWCAMLWDMYWAFVDTYGFSDDPINGDLGNNMAIQLVMDGMKFQATRPGFVDARDAILTADVVNNEGANQCLIWEVFARRGLGFHADQGSVNSAADGKTSFESNPRCIKELKVAKASTPFINPGEDIEVTLTVMNHKDSDVSNVVVSNFLPAGVSYKSTSSTITPSEDNGQIIFEVGPMMAGEEMEISYTLSSDPGKFSNRLFFDNMENGEDNWDIFLDENLPGFDFWTIIDVEAFSGEFAYFVADVEEESDHQLRTRQPIQVNAATPFIRFYHSYEFDPLTRDNAGFVTVSRDGGANFERVEGKLVRGDYPGRIEYTTFAMPNLQAFWGESEGFIATYLDLSDYIGESVLIDFRYGSDDDANNADSNEGVGWFIDDFEYMDLLSYNGEACITSDEGDNNCAIAPSYGTIVESAVGSVKVEDLTDEEVFVKVQPNPVSDIAQIVLKSNTVQEAKMTVVDITGKIAFSQKINLTGDTQSISVDVSNMPSGMYFVNIFAQNKQRSLKFIVE